MVDEIPWHRHVYTSRVDTAELSRWMGLVAAIWVQAFAGNTSAYANYSSTLKSVLGISQVQLNYIALAKDIGESVGVVAGLICNKVPPWVMLSIAALECFCGFGTIWLVASRTISARPVWQMCIAIFIGGNSMTWFNTAVLVTCMRNFHKSRGTIVGFLKGFIGLSGAIFTQIFLSFLSKDAVELILFLAIGPTIVCLCTMGFIRPVHTSGEESLSDAIQEQKQFRFIYVVCVALAVYLFALVFVDEFIDNSLVLLVSAIVMILFLIAPIGVPLKIFIQGLMSKQPNETENTEELVSSVEPTDELYRPIEEPYKPMDRETIMKKILKYENEEDSEILYALGEGAVKRKKRRPRRGEDFKLKQALIKADFWLLFFIFFCGVGTAVTANNNLSQIGEAQGYSDVSTFVLLAGIWGFLGRLGGGSVSEHFIRCSTSIPRPVWIGAALALMIVTHLLFAFAIPGTLYVAASLMGLCFGIMIAVLVPTASEIFGLKHFGILYNFITLADPLASLIFSTLLVGNLYDLEVIRQFGSTSTEEAENVCTGAHCFKLSFFIMAGVCALGVVLSIILSVRLQPVYNMLYGGPDSGSASYSVLPSDTSYTSLPSVNASSTNLLPATFAFPHVSSSSAIAQDSDQELR